MSLMMIYGTELITDKRVLDFAIENKLWIFGIDTDDPCIQSLGSNLLIKCIEDKIEKMIEE